MSFYTESISHSKTTTFANGFNPICEGKSIKELVKWLAEVGPKDAKVIATEFKVTDNSVRRTLKSHIEKETLIRTKVFDGYRSSGCFVYSPKVEKYAH